MTELEKQALALVNQVLNERYAPPCPGLQRRTNSYHEAIFRALEQKAALQAEFDQHKRDVSDKMFDLIAEYGVSREDTVGFILPNHDPLVEAMNEMGFGCSDTDAKGLRAALAKRNARIVWEAE